MIFQIGRDQFLEVTGAHFEFTGVDENLRCLISQGDTCIEVDGSHWARKILERIRVEVLDES